MTLLDHLINQFPTAKRQTLKRMVESRRVLINGRPATRTTQQIPADARIQILPPARSTPPSLPFPIIHEDADILVIDKPPGLLTSTTPREPRPTAIAAVSDYLAVTDPGSRPGLIHRLDRDASGLLVFSKNPLAFSSLKKQFFHHTAARIYLALVSPPPNPPSGKIETLLTEHADGSVHVTRSRGQRAITHYETLKKWDDRALLRVTLETGRKHQIRAHLSHLKSPIVGDEMYGGTPNSTGLMLTAIELHLDHPRASRRQIFKIPPPPRFLP